MNVCLGVICHGWNESAAVLVSDGSVIAAAEEERFTLRKFDNAFPIQAIRFCLASAGITAKDLDSVGFGVDPGRRLGGKLACVVKYFPGSLHLIRTRAPLAVVA